ncbi:hypothetical protein [Xanthomonas arboricola]|uniref:hypothetical protein n=1 Tax=Xanthomonas arboricola TaxID=56448 RepID=UPI0011B068FF|nr:hypothetical protein [Xanthomonas arboricola]
MIHLGGTNAEPVIGIVGRFVKDGIISREQVYRQGSLVKNHAQLQSSPSALFLLILNNHRLVYLKETSFAPNKEAFRSTVLKFLRETHIELRKKQFEIFDEKNATRIVRRELKDEWDKKYPRPTLDLIALTTEDSIEEFIGRYEVLKAVKITFKETNDESSLNDFLRTFKRTRWLSAVIILQ